MNRLCLLYGICWLIGSVIDARAASPITAVRFAPDGESIVTGSQEGIFVLAAPELRPSRELKTRLVHVHDLQFAPGGEFLAAAGGAPGEAGVVELFTWPDGKPALSVTPADDVLLAVAWQPSGKGWAAAGYDTAVYVGDAKGNIAGALRGHSRPVTSLGFLADGKFLVTASVDQSLRVWDVTTEKQQRSLENHVLPVTALALQPHDEDAPPVLASAGEDRTVRLWQPTVPRMMRFAKLSDYAVDLAWTPDGALLLAACRDGHLRVIDPRTVQVVRDIEALDGRIHCLDVSPDGAQAVVGGEDGLVKMVDLDAIAKRERGTP